MKGKVFSESVSVFGLACVLLLAALSHRTIRRAYSSVDNVAYTLANKISGSVVIEVA